MDVTRTDAASRAARRRRRPWLWGDGGVVVAGALWAAVGSLQPAARSVEAETLWIGTVERGEMLREVRGPGTLVPAEERWIAALTEGRVERILLQPGTAVGPDTVILELSNPAVERRARDAEWQLEAARADHGDLRARLQGELLDRRASAAAVEAELRDAELTVEAHRRLADEGLLPELELRRSEIRAQQLARRHALEQERLEKTGQSVEARLGSAAARLDQAEALAELRRRELESLAVRAALDGVLQQVPVEEGQQVAPGTDLARVARPDRLQAELRIAETQATDLEPGQPARIDTRNGVVAGRVARVDPAAREGTVTVEVELEGELPRGTRPQQSVDGSIEIERLEEVLFVGRPAFVDEGATVGLFRLTPDGRRATRVQVRLGRSSIRTVEVIAGLDEGDRVILSDSGEWAEEERLRLE